MFSLHILNLSACAHGRCVYRPQEMKCP